MAPTDPDKYSLPPVTMSWTTGDDATALADFKERLMRWFRIQGTPAKKQSDIIIFALGIDLHKVVTTYQGYYI